MKAQFLAALKKTMGNLSQAGDMIEGFNMKYHYLWMNDDPKYREEVAKTVDRTHDFVESKLLKLINKENPQAIFFYLSRKAKHRGWGENMEVNMNLNAIRVIDSGTKGNIRISQKSKKQEEDYGEPGFDPEQ